MGMIIDHSTRAERSSALTAVPGPDIASETGPVDAEHAQSWALVRAAQAGDLDAFATLYDRYLPVVYRFVCHRVKDRSLAEDFTSETFLRALRRFPELNYQGRDIGAWFITIARNIVLDHVKSARFRLELSTGDVAPFAPASADATGSPEAATLARLANERLTQAINSLNAEQRECVVLRFLHELSVAETAEVMGKNGGAIKALQHRALKRLTVLLGDEQQ
jgi:RNA polymerase sigma-70 factor (ECF subfamily)